MRSTEGFVTADDGARLFCRTLGDGPQTVIVANQLYLFDDFKRLARADRTLVLYDLRNRGRSETLPDPSALGYPPELEIADVEAVRRHCGAERAALIGHSYVAALLARYAMRHPARVERLVQLGPPPPDPGKQYPPDLTCVDDALLAATEKLARLAAEAGSLDAATACRRFWAIARPLFVAEPRDEQKIASWGYCDVPNEANLWQRALRGVLPPQVAASAPEDFAKVTAPVLIVHGRRDRQAPYGGGRDWALALANARLLTVPSAAHAPWLEAPWVLAAIDEFLASAWPAGAERLGAQ